MNTQDRTTATHNAGAERHADVWLAANIRACEAANSRGLAPWSSPGKEAIPAIVLRVLDGLKISAGLDWDKEKKEWVKASKEV